MRLRIQWFRVDGRPIREKKKETLRFEDENDYEYDI